MKNINFKIFTALLFLILASISCSAHCDDEDYTRDSEPQSVIMSDSLKVDTTPNSKM